MQDYIDFIQSNMLLVAAWVGIFVGLVVTSVRLINSKFKSISHQEAVTLINKEDAVIFDLRNIDAFNRGHVVRALHVQFSEVKKDEMARFDKYKGKPVITVCELGHQSEQAAALLVKQGFEYVYHLKGGMSDWSAHHLPTVK